MQFAHPARLKLVLAVETHVRCLPQRRGIDAGREMARDEGRAGAGGIAQRTERRRPTPRHRPRIGRHRRQHLARPQPVRAMRLILQRERE